MTVSKRRLMRGGSGGIALCACLLLAPAALADVRTGSVTDPTGDAAYPEQDITAAEVSYDTQGGVTVKVTFAAAPAAPGAMVVAQLYKSTGADCASTSDVADFGAAAVAATETQFAPLASLKGQPITAPTISQADNVVTLQVTDARIANQPWDCAGLGAGTPGSSPNVQDPTDKVRLGGGAAPPTPAPAPSGAPALTAAKLAPASLAAARRGSTFTKRGKARLTFTLSAAATVTVTIQRKSGRRWRRLKGSATQSLPAGNNTLRFTGRWRGKRLQRGRYRLVLTPSGQSGAGQPVRVPFRIR